MSGVYPIMDSNDGHVAIDHMYPILIKENSINGEYEFESFTLPGNTDAVICLRHNAPYMYYYCGYIDKSIDVDPMVRSNNFENGLGFSISYRHTYCSKNIMELPEAPPMKHDRVWYGITGNPSYTANRGMKYAMEHDRALVLERLNILNNLIIMKNICT